MVFGFGKKSTVTGQDPVTTTSTSGVLEKDGIGNEKSGLDGDVRSASSGNDIPNNTINEVEANRELKFLKKLHRWDPNLSADVQDGMARAVHDHDGTAELELLNLMENDSPYPEVRAAVRNYDIDMPTNTIRAWTIGMFMVTLGSGMNMLFSMRSPQIIITAFVAQLVAYPIGLGWDLIMPRRQFNTFGVKWSLNPSPFNMKEHALITIMANVTFGAGAAYSTDTIVAQKGFYHQDFGVGFQLLLTLGTQMIGYGYAGMLRKYLVWPASMIWPTNFVNTSLFYALHDHTPSDPAKANGWSVGRYRYFLYVFIGSFVWYWFPGMFTLSLFCLGKYANYLRLDFSSTLILCFRHLDRTKQRCCQPVVWLPDWTWSYPNYFRLDSDHWVHSQSSHVPMARHRQHHHRNCLVFYAHNHRAALLQLVLRPVSAHF